MTIEIRHVNKLTKETRKRLEGFIAYKYPNATVSTARYNNVVVTDYLFYINKNNVMFYEETESIGRHLWDNHAASVQPVAYFFTQQPFEINKVR